MEIAEMATTSRARSIGRRGLVMGAALAGLSALAACRSMQEVATPETLSQPSGDEIKLRHLLRRAGFGASPADLQQYRPLGLTGAVDRLVDFDTVDNSALEARLKSLNLDLTKRQDIQRWWLLRMIYTARPLEEKMTLFWHGLLTSALSKVGRAEPMIRQNQVFRVNALGRFPDILKAVSKDPAMMIWLDNETNRKGHPNENYARELMELFSLGLGHYTEQDVRESARAFTGWVLRGNRKLGEVESVFQPRLHDDGAKTFLGQTGNFDGDAIVDLIVKQPASATFIARKLFSFFAYPNPSDDVLQPLVSAYTVSNFSIKALVRAILTSEAFYSPQSYRALIKSPAELVAGAARTLSLETDAKGVPSLMTQMGQELFNPPNVAGWPGGPAWLNSGTWLARLNFANVVVNPVETASKRLASTNNPLPVPAAAAPSDVVDRLGDLLLDGQIATKQRQVLLDYLTPASGTSPSAAWTEERRRGALYLALTMPEDHLA